ncbi:hypothetical protein BFR38_03165 [Brochothrix thermosphacta]|uniref:hypothetical protein n=1 Tax=Brochothrix thermosphacta TaxID=2756 RepID=UPI00083FCCFC|nr:hypothetical protein [Brochothrix thermosphacta]ODJ51996.1 hypothetical protein BFR38_03165 [Brochothrix thermosphacta]
MSRNKPVNYHPKFISYIEQIIHHKNYKDLPIRLKKNGAPLWIAAKKSKTDNTGIKRTEWADKKAYELGFQNSIKKYADTMFAIHPTKKKVCQWCGEIMDLHYIYPTKNTIKYFQKNFKYVYDKYDSIYDIVIKLPEFEKEIKKYLSAKASLSEIDKNSSIDDVIIATEFACRMEGKSIFSPGAMSNFPDRFDGFHSYNLCCRKSKDKGRHDNNMATYNKDRRAYEYWSDGNIAAADQLMRNPSLFQGMSADHIGPISLGFIHDPIYIQPMSSSNNSAKRDRLYDDDIKKLIYLENISGKSPASYFAIVIWEFIKNDYTYNNKSHSLEWYRMILKQNMMNFMESIWILLDTENTLTIKKFFIDNFFENKYNCYFKYRYEFNDNGTIKTQYIRNITESAKQEFNRFVRISFESVADFHLKSGTNRKISSDLSIDEINELKKIQKNILSNIKNKESSKKLWEEYIEKIQIKLIEKWSNYNIL